MMISTRGRYALRILADLAEHRSGAYIPLKEVATRQDISEKYLESIVRELVREGVVEGLRGKGGGYRLCKDPDEIRVGDVLRCTEGTLAPVACLEKNAAPCAKSSQCRTLKLWTGLNTLVNEYLDNYSIDDLIEAPQPGNDYII